MKVIREYAGNIPGIIKEYIKDRNVTFVFASSIQLDSWAEWCIENSSETGVKAVAMDRFLAWDHFKEQFAASGIEGKNAIPSVLRKFFVTDLIERNATAVKEGNPLLSKVIVPEYAEESRSFVSSISSMLPMLKKWKESMYEYLKNNPDYKLDEEDRDYEFLFNEYSKFLGDDLFEPAWQIPDFSGANKKFILIYPEQLLDYSEYEPLFKGNDNIIIYKLPLEKEYKQKVRVFSDSRKELRRCVLKIRDIVETSDGNVNYEDIAFHVNDLDSVRPYIEREFEKYRVPVVIRKAEPVLVNSAAVVFSQIKNCVSSNYSYESMRTLLLNSYIPWKEMTVNENLVREGSNLHIICNYENGQENDQWIKALKAIPEDYREYKYYCSLKKAMESFCYATSFENIRKAWIIFKNDFLTEEWSEKANLVLGKCITELDKLIQIEKDFMENRNLSIPNCFDFFLSELENLNYAPQKTVNGVSVFEYRVACGAAFKYNFIFDASQKSLAVPYRPLAFLNSQKRKALQIFDEDVATEVFIELYGWNNSINEEHGFFTCSIESFSGFSIPHSLLEECSLDKGDPWKELDEKDFIIAEQKFFLESDEEKRNLLKINKLSDLQIKEFEKWSSVSDFVLTHRNDYSASSDLRARVDDVCKIKRAGCFDSMENAVNVLGNAALVHENEKARINEKFVKITQTDLDGFFKCPRYWLFGNVLKFREETLDTDLFSNYDQGNINHKALELLLWEFERSGKKLPCVQEDGTFGDDEEEMRELISKCVYEAIHSREMTFAKSPLVLEVLESQIGKFENVIDAFMHSFCDPGKKGKVGGFNVLSREKWFSGFNKESEYVYSGKLDLILKDDFGNVYIIDYKNGATPTAKSCKSSVVETEEGTFSELNNFQCAMYVLLWNLNNSDVNAALGMSFESIRDKNERVIFWGSDEALDYKNSVETLKDYTDIFNDAVTVYSFDPNGDVNEPKIHHYTKVDAYEDCVSCKYKSICRTSYTVGQKKL